MWVALLDTICKEAANLLEVTKADCHFEFAARLCAIEQVSRNDLHECHFSMQLAKRLQAARSDKMQRMMSLKEAGKK